MPGYHLTLVALRHKLSSPFAAPLAYAIALSMLHIIGYIFLLGLHWIDFVSARAIQCTKLSMIRLNYGTDKWQGNIKNSTPISPSSEVEDSRRTSATSLQATVASEAERHSRAPSTDDHSPSAQSALYTARPSGAITLAISRPCMRVEPQLCSLFGARPLYLVPGGSSGLLSRHASGLSSKLPTGTDRFLPATTSTITHSTAGPGNLLPAFEQLATLSESTSLLPTGPVPTMSAVGSAEATQNALSVLLVALPSDVASSIEAGFSVVTKQLLATSGTVSSTLTTRPTSLPSSVPTTISTSRSEHIPQSSRGPSESERQTSGYTARPTTQQDEHTRPTSYRPTDHTSSPISRPTSRPTESHEPHRPTTLSTLPIPSTTQTSSQSTSSTSSSLNPSSTTAPESSEPAISPQKQQANGTIAGVATGAAAGAVLIVLAIFFFLRRRQRKRSLKAVEEEAAQPFPTVAWLYDPVRSPPRAQSPAPQNAEAAGILAVAQGQSRRNSAHAPEVVAMPEGEPLLAPGRAATRDSSPGGNERDRSVSPGDMIR